jgi:tripartite ATP-independent transporter DctM subunit
VQLSFFLTGLIALFLVGVPIAFAMGLTSFGLMYINWGEIRTGVISQMMLTGVNSFVLLSVPLFILSGRLMNTGGVSERIFRFADSLVGFLPGGLGHVNVVASMIFSGMTGTAVADAVGTGSLEIKAMKDAGYNVKFAAAITATSATIGPIIPPSLPMVIYGVVAGVSVGSLFLGGIIPGFIMGLLMMVMVSLMAIKNKFPRGKMLTFRQFWVNLKAAFLPLLTPLMIIGGIYTGMFTPTEAAVVAVLYAFILGKFLYRELSWQDVYSALRESVRDSALIGLIIAAATLYGNLVVRSLIPQMVLDHLSSYITSAAMALLLLNIFLLIIGCFMETLAAITILMPIILPILEKFDIDPVHFGVIMVLNLMIGVITPPFGLVLFVIARIAKLEILTLVRALLPWYGVLIAALIIVTIFPQTVLWIPNLLAK